MNTPPSAREKRPPERWQLRQPFGPRAIAIALVLSLLLGLSARRTEIDKMVFFLGQYVAYELGLQRDSQVAKGFDRYGSNAFPLQLRDVTAVSRIPGFDRSHLPLFSHLEMQQETTSHYDDATSRMVSTTETREVLVRPLGYLQYVVAKMVESLELALWGTLVGIAVGAPIAYLGTRGYTPHPVVRGLARGVASYLRALPELVSALFLVLAFGPGAIAGVLALGLHSAGFFGKFYADDAENTERGPQDALVALGANRLKVFRYAVLPQVLPQYASYTQYVLERNVRMATVMGVVGAGGIGVELKGRFDQFEFGHVTTIVLVLLLTVMGLEQLTLWARRRMIG